MRFTTIKKSEINRPKYKLNVVFTEFIRMNVETVRVSFSENEYKNVTSAYKTLSWGAKRWNFPIRVILRNNEIYFLRTDWKNEEES